MNRFTQERRKIKYQRATYYKICHWVFLSYELLKSRKRRIFLPTSYIQGQLKYGKPRKPLSPPGLVCCHKGGTWERKEKKKKDQGRWSVATRRGREENKKRKEKKKTKEGKKVAPAKARFRVPYTKNSFFWFTSIWVLKRPVLVEVSAPAWLQGSHVRRKFRKWTTLRSESSTLKGLLYAPIKQEQYHKRTTLRRLKIPLRSIVAKKGRTIALERSMSKKAVTWQARINLYSRVGYPWWFHTWAVLCSLAKARKCQLEDFCEKERYESCPVQRTCTGDAFRKVWKGENLPVVKLLPGSHEGLAF